MVCSGGRAINLWIRPEHTGLARLHGKGEKLAAERPWAWACCSGSWASTSSTRARTRASTANEASTPCPPGLAGRPPCTSRRWPTSGRSRRSAGLAIRVAGERRRKTLGYADSRWTDRTKDVAELAGSSLMSGFAGILFKRFNGRVEDRLLLDALLNLAPGLIQTLAALTDRPSSAGGMMNPQGPGGGLMQVVGMGGREDSCYMWRKGSPLLQIRENAMVTED